MKRALVTGATGFVGANLARRLIADGHEVHLVVRRSSDRWRLSGIEDSVRIHTEPLSDAASISRLVEAVTPQWVFHLAAHGAYSWQKDWRQMVETNLVGTICLVEACLAHGCEAFINTGSSSEYGFKDHPPAESDWLEPNSHYALTKASATQYCRFVARQSKANLVTLRLYSVYGPYEEPNRLMPTLAVRGLSGQLPPLVDRSVARDYVYVDDVVTAYLLAANAGRQEPGAVYNVGSGSQTTLEEVVACAGRVLPIREEPRWGTMPNRGWDTSVWVADNRKIKAELGWQPLHSLEAGIEKLSRWLQENPQMLDFYRERIAAAPLANR